MEFKNGTNVYTADGKGAGSLHRVVLDPQTKEVTHIVIQRGLLVKEDKVIPMAKVASASQEKVALNCEIDELKEMPPLVIEHIVPTDEGQTYGKVLGGINMPPNPEADVRMEATRTIPDDLVALKEGARVMSEDDKHVGDIEQIFTEEGKATRLTLTQGTLVKNKKTIPFEMVKMVSDDEVDLTIQAQQLEEMPADEGQ